MWCAWYLCFVPEAGPGVDKVGTWAAPIWGLLKQTQTHESPWIPGLAESFSVTPPEQTKKRHLLEAKTSWQPPDSGAPSWCPGGQSWLGRGEAFAELRSSNVKQQAYPG